MEDEGIVQVNKTLQENICLVNASLDENLLAFYASGESDMHSYNARMIFPDELKDMSLDEIKKNRPDLREIAKAVSFALAYGGNGYTISNNLGIPPAEGDAIYDAYFEAFPGLLKHFERKINESMTRGHIVIDEVTNRKFYFSDFGELNQYKKDRNWSAFYRLKGKYERACLNYCIQGAAGSITKLAGILFRQYILDNDYENEIMITNMVHDEILVECTDNERTQQHADMLEQCMFRAGERWSQTVPLVAEAVIADYWHH